MSTVPTETDDSGALALAGLGVEIFPREGQTPEALGALVKADAESADGEKLADKIRAGFLSASMFPPAGYVRSRAHHMARASVCERSSYRDTEYQNRYYENTQSANGLPLRNRSFDGTFKQNV